MDKFIRGDIIIQMASDDTGDNSFMFQVVDVEDLHYWLVSLSPSDLPEPGQKGEGKKGFPCGKFGCENYCRKATDKEASLCELLYE